MSVQIPTRIELDAEHNGVLMQILPDGRPDSFFGLSHEAFLTRTRDLRDAGKLKPLSEFLVFYECRCDEAMILDMITALPKNQRKELWGDENELTIECPRCGREYVLHKKNTLH
jgi:redox-regulated HSP33 family molecular chaperone